MIGSYTFFYKVKELAHQPLFDYAGTFGTTALGLQGGAYRWRLLTNLGYRWGPATLGLQWQHLPSVEDSGQAIAPTAEVGDPHSYDLFGLNGSYQVTGNLTIRGGVDNLFNRAPPITNYTVANMSGNLVQPPGQGQLGSFEGGFYDTVGRTFYIAGNVKF